MNTLKTILDQLLNGLTTGAQYALVASGVAIIWGVVGLVNFAQGQFYVLACYVVVLLLTILHLPYALVIVIVVMAMGCFGASVQWAVIRPIVRQPWQSQLVATLGLSVLITALVTVLIGTTPQSAPTTFSSMTLRVGPLDISWQRVLLILGTACAFVVLWFFLKYHRMGRAMRAMSQNREACAAAGIQVQPVSMLTFAIGAALAGLGAALYAPLTSIYPTMADLLIIKAFVVVIMGGLGRIDSTVAAAFVLGIAEAFTAQYITVTYVDVVAAILMVVFILWRPYGLFGQRVGI
jgi:branched-chain amino acid transport system permease protein